MDAVYIKPFVDAVQNLFNTMLDLPFALENEFDLLLLDQTDGIESPWVELDSPFDLTVLRKAYEANLNADKRMQESAESGQSTPGGSRCWTFATTPS